jgi:aarF domain-containing kinase
MTLQLLSLSRHVRRCVDILIDVHGYQILRDGTFNGDPHGGNLLQLKNGKLGLIDYGQTRRLNDHERLAISRIVVELSNEPTDVHKVAEAMRDFGFKTKFNRDEMMAKYARLFFDNDAEGKELGCATPQLYLLKLSMMDPLNDVPDAAVFVARASYMFRGMGSMTNEQVLTAQRWAKHAMAALSAADL